jgi:hypothetical protein
VVLSGFGSQIVLCDRASSHAHRRLTAKPKAKAASPGGEA